MSDSEAIIDFDNAGSRRMLLAYLKTLRGEYRVTVKKPRAGRTSQQNRWYWGQVLPAVARGLAEAWGEALTVDEVHVWLRARYLAKPIVNHQTGEVVAKRPGSTAVLDTKEFGEYLDKILLFAAEQLGVEIPQPTQEPA